VRTDYTVYVTVCAWSGGEVEESGNKLSWLCHCLCLVWGRGGREGEQIRLTMSLSVPGLGVR